MTGAGVQSTWAGAQRNARRRPLTTLDYTAWAQRRGGLPAVHLTRDRQCREGGSNSHEVLPSTDFKCFAVNRNHLILLAIPPLQRFHCVRLCVSFGQAVGVVDAFCWPKDCATVHGEPTRKTVRRGVALPNGESSPPRPPPRVPSEPPRLCRRLHDLRGWSHGTTERVLTGDRK